MPEIGALTYPLKYGDTQAEDYLEIEKTGFIRMNGSAISYRDVYPSYILPLSGAAAPDSVGYTIGGVPTQLYSYNGAATEEVLSAKFEIDHDLLVDLVKLQALGTPPEFHVHWCPTTTATGTVKWFVDWCHIPANGSPAGQTTLSATHAVTVASQYNNLIVTIGAFPSDLEFEIGDIILAVLRRTPGDAEDTYGADAGLYQFAIHAPCDTNGSRGIFTK